MYLGEEIFNKTGIVITFVDMKTRVTSMQGRIMKRNCIAAPQTRSNLMEKTADHAEMQKTEVEIY